MHLYINRLRNVPYILYRSLLFDITEFENENYLRTKYRRLISLDILISIDYRY
jgi:hypothetical protein